MPSKSAKQHRFMEAAAHNPEFAAKAGIDQSVAKEFAAADERRGTYNVSRQKKGLIKYAKRMKNRRKEQ